MKSFFYYSMPAVPVMHSQLHTST